MSTAVAPEPLVRLQQAACARSEVTPAPPAAHRSATEFCCHPTGLYHDKYGVKSISVAIRQVPEMTTFVSSRNFPSSVRSAAGLRVA